MDRNTVIVVTVIAGAALAAVYLMKQQQRQPVAILPPAPPPPQVRQGQDLVGTVGTLVQAGESLFSQGKQLFGGLFN